MNTQIATTQCQTGTYALQGVPAANFTINSTECLNSNIALNDASGYAPTGWSWTMSGGTPAFAYVQNTAVSYSSTGTKSITLNAGNLACGNFQSNSITKMVNIINFTHPIATCPINNTNTGTAIDFGGGILNVTLSTINNSTGSSLADGYVYADYSCGKFATITDINTAINISITVGNWNTENVNVYVDLNNDATFQGGELLLTLSGTNTLSGTITIPNTAVRNKLLRMRVVSDLITPSACTTPTYGQVEDYVYSSLPIIYRLS